MDADRRMLVRTGLAFAALLAVSAATAAVAKGGVEERRVESVGTDVLGPAAPVGVRVPPVVTDEAATVSAPPSAPSSTPTSAPESIPVVITPATVARTSVPVATTVPATTTVPTTGAPPAAAPPVSEAVATAPDTSDAGPQATRCLDLADLTAARHDARTRVVRVEGLVGNCGSLDITFVVRVTDVTNHADAACDAGTRSTGVLVLGPASGDAWSALTYPAPCPEPYTFRVTAVDADGEQLALRSLTFPG